MSERVRLPDERRSVTKKLVVRCSDGDVKLYVQVGFYPDGRPGEIFLKADQVGSTLSGMLDALSMCMSVALQAGVPLSWFVEKMKNLQFEPAGPTSDPKVRYATSIVDGLAKWLEYRFPTSEAPTEPPTPG